MTGVRMLGNRQGPVRSGVTLRRRGRLWVLLGADLATSSPLDVDAVEIQVALAIARRRSWTMRLVPLLTLTVWAFLVLLADIAFPDRPDPVNAMMTAYPCFVALVIVSRTTIVHRGLRQTDQRAASVVGARRLADTLERLVREGQQWPPGPSIWLFLVPIQHYLPARAARLREGAL